MNKKSKGRHHEKVITELLRQAGWTVHLVQPAVAYNPKSGRYYSRPQDIFGADILAIKRLKVPLFIQVTCHSGIGQKIKTFQSYSFPWPFVRVLIFQAKKNTGRWKYKAIMINEHDIEDLGGEELFDIFGDLYRQKRELFLVEKE